MSKLTSRQKRQLVRHKARQRDIYAEAAHRTYRPAVPITKRQSAADDARETAWPYLPGGER